MYILNNAGRKENRSNITFIYKFSRLVAPVLESHGILNFILSSTEQQHGPILPTYATSIFSLLDGFTRLLSILNALKLIYLQLFEKWNKKSAKH